MKLLMGGSFAGGSNWNKTANEIDKCFKIYFFRDGNAEIVSIDKSYTLQKGKLYFINGFAIESQRCQDRMMVEWLHFLPESVYFNHLLKFCACVQELNSEDFSSFIDVFGQLQAYFNQGLPGSDHRKLQLEIQSLIQFTLARVFHSLDPRILEKDDTFNRLFPTLEFITDNYRNNISLEDIAARSNLSPNYFHRLFTRTFHVSPFAYIRQMRMDEAVRQLVYTDKTVKEIAYDTGYEDEAYFSRTFTKLNKISPGKFRIVNRKKLP